MVSGKRAIKAALLQRSVNLKKRLAYHHQVEIEIGKVPIQIMLNSLSTCVVLEEHRAQGAEYLIICLQANFGAEEFYQYWCMFT